MASPHLREIIPAGTVITASGSQVVDGGEGFGVIKTLRVQFNATAVSGTTPNLTFVVEDTLDGTNWNVLTPSPAISAITAVARQVVDFTTPFSDNLRIRWTVTGTTPSFTLGVMMFVDPV